MPRTWLPVVGYEERYEVSDDGLVKSVSRKRVIKHQICKKTGYARIVLWKDGNPRAFSVHRLVAFAFLGRPKSPDMDVAHNDGVRTNNYASNLRWATKSENQADRLKHGTADRPKGIEHGMSKISGQDVIAIRVDRRTQNEIAAAYGISQAQVSNIKNRANWVHI